MRRSLSSKKVQQVLKFMADRRARVARVGGFADRKRSALSAAAAPAVEVLEGRTLLSTTLSWVGGSGPNWGTAANWSPAQVPANGDDLVFDWNTANFVQSDAARYSSNNDLTGLQINSLRFNEQFLTNDFSLSGNGITLGSGGVTNNVLGTATIGLAASSVSANASITNNNGILNLNTGSLLIGANTLAFAGSSTTTVNAAVSGSGGLTINGAGTVQLAGANAYTGGTTVSGGTLVATNASAFGTGAVSVLSGATLDVRAAVGNALSLAGTGVGGAGALVTGNGTGQANGNITLSANTTIGRNGLTLGGRVNGAFALATAGTGNISFSNLFPIGVSTPLTTFTTNAGNTGDTTFFTHSGGAVMTTTGSQTYNDRVAITQSSGELNIIVNSAGAVAFNGLLDGPGDLFVQGAVSTITFAQVVGGTTPLARVATVSGEVILNGGTVTTGTGIGGFGISLNGAVTLAANTTLKASNSDVRLNGAVNGANSLNVSAGTGTARINAPVGGTTALTGLNISGPTVFGPGATSVTTTGDQTYGGAVTIQGSTALNTGTLTAGAVSVATNLTLNNSGAGSISGVVTGAGTLTKDGAGNLTLSGTNTYAGGTTLNGGVFTLGSGATAGSGALTFGAAKTATLRFAGGTGLANTVKGFGTDDTIDVAGIGTATGFSLGANNVLTISGGTVSPITLNLDPTQSFTGKTFALTSDGAGGTFVNQVQVSQTSTAVTSSNATATYGDSVTLTATVTNTETLAAPAGAVTFTIDGIDYAGTSAGTAGNQSTWTYTFTQLAAQSSPHSVSATYTPTINFSGSSGSLSGGQTITQRALTVSGLAVTAREYDGTTAATLDFAGATLVNKVTGDSVSLDSANFAASFSSKNAGTWPVTVTNLGLKGAAAANYTVTLPTGLSGTINQVTPAVSLNPINITFGTALSNGQLSGAASATVNGQTVNVPGVFTFTSAAGTVPNGGNGQSFGVTFTPTDATNFMTASPTVTVNVAKATPSVSVDEVNLTYGTGLSNTQLTGTATYLRNGTPTAVPGTFTYVVLGGAGAGKAPFPNAGNGQSFDVTFTPTDTTNFDTVATTVTVNVAKASPSAAVNGFIITYGTALSNGLLSGTASATVGGLPISVPGTFTFTSAAGTIPNAGTGQTAAVTFTPTDSSNFNSAATSVTFDVSKATAVIVVTPYSVDYDGQVHTATATITGVNGESGAAVGTVDLSGTSHTNAGSYNDTYTFTPTSNYNVDAGGIVNNVIRKIDATIITTPYSVTYDGQPHTATVVAKGIGGVVLAGVDVSGTTHTDAGTYTDTWTFIDATGNYNNIAGKFDNVIDPATPTLKVSAPGGVYNGSPFAATGSVTGVNDADLGTPTFKYFLASDTTRSSPLPSAPVNVGDYVVEARYANDTNYLALKSYSSFSITQASAVFTIAGVSLNFDNLPHPATGTAAGVESPTPADLSSLLTLAYKNLATNAVSSSAPVQPGTYAVLATFAGNTNYAAVSQFDTGKTVEIRSTSPVFGLLSNPTIITGTAGTTISGRMSSPVGIPVGFPVKIAINGVTVSATIQTGGGFSAVFPTGKLGVGTYTITYAFAGTKTIAAGSATSKLLVTQQTKVLFNNSIAYKVGSTIGVVFEVEDAKGKDIPSTTRTATATGIAAVVNPTLAKPLPAGSSPGGVFTPNADRSKFTLSLKTTGLTAGQYLLYFTISGDPVSHALTFILK